jgi:thiol-disulfide isomerase/thioredoxin
MVSTLVSFNAFATVEFNNLQLDKAEELAILKGKQVFVEFYIEDCPSCKIMDKEVFSKPSIYEHLNKNYVSIRVNTRSEYGKILKKQYQINTYPSYVFIAVDDDRFYKKLIGKRTIQEFLEESQVFLAPEQTFLYKMEKEYQAGNRSPGFLMALIDEMKRNHLPTSDIAKDFFRTEEVDLMDYNQFALLLEAKLSFDNKYVQEVIGSADQFTIRFPDLSKRLYSDVVFGLYENAMIHRDQALIIDNGAKLIELINHFADLQIDADNYVQYLKDHYRPSQPWFSPRRRREYC